MEAEQVPWNLLNKLESRSEVADETSRLRVFQEICCESMASVLPTDAGSWLNVAQAYRLGKATEADLEAVRVAAWKFLGPTSCNVDVPRVAAVRALIGLLVPDDYSPWEGVPPRVGRFEWLHFFLNLCNTVVDRRSEQSRLLVELFPELGAQLAEPGAASTPRE